MKKLPRIIWITCLFTLLLLILFLIVNYKINYEYLNYNYLYFYECDKNLCMSNTFDNKKLIYSKYECGYESCPEYVKKIKDDYIILKKDTEFILYNYRTSNIISSNYEDYEFINSNYIIVSSKNKKGIININNDVIVPLIYDEIGYKNNDYLAGYNLNNIIVKKEGLYGIISYKDGNIVEETKYSTIEEVSSILDK